MIFDSLDSFRRFKRPFVTVLRVAAVFLILFSVVYFYLAPARGMILSILEPWAGFFSFFHFHLLHDLALALALALPHPCLTIPRPRPLSEPKKIKTNLAGDDELLLLNAVASLAGGSIGSVGIAPRLLASRVN